MKASTIEWIEKAEGDFDMALRAYRARKRPNYDAACFHAQQCIEKYLKARLNEAGIVIQKTHNLVDLLNDVLPAEPTWATLHITLATLTKYAVLYRYPGYDATKLEAKTAIKDCRNVRRIIRTVFGLPV
ncbi:MAG: HEPN domain-containing protein [Blastocatellales bacterium]